MSNNVFNVENENIENIVENENIEEVKAVNEKTLPAKVSVWTKIKDFLLQDASKIKIELKLTPGEQKFIDFWTQEVTIDKAYKFLFQEIKFK